MKHLFDESSFQISRLVTRKYSTSFSLGIRLLSAKIRPSIYAIYGFVRYADEIVDTFLDHDREQLLDKFVADYELALRDKISLNPILNAFQQVVHEYALYDLVHIFVRSMRMDLEKNEYQTTEEHQDYIYGSADVVGLMCLKVFVGGDEVAFQRLKPYAQKLGSAFQKVNFLRDYLNDVDVLGRSYFPQVVRAGVFSDAEKEQIVADIRADFSQAIKGIRKLPKSCRLGVLLAYKYYINLTNKLDRKSSRIIKEERVRISNSFKGYIFLKAYVRHAINVI